MTSHSSVGDPFFSPSKWTERKIMESVGGFRALSGVETPFPALASSSSWSRSIMGHDSKTSIVLSSTGLSQQELADLLGVNQSTVSRWVNGEAEPNFLVEVVLDRIMARDWSDRRKARLKSLLTSGDFPGAIIYAMGTP